MSDGVTAADYDACLRRANQQTGSPLSVYVHLPFCEHRCLFCGCNVIITQHKERARPYLDLLMREVDLVAERLPDRRDVAQLHLGGGTPTYSDPDELRGTLEHLLGQFTPTPDAEIAVEVDPRVTTDAHVDMLASLGFNRMSMGVQDFTPAVQQAIERIQSVEQTEHLIGHARAAGFRGINVDLIYGLPHQTPASFEKTVDEAVRLGVDRVAVYSFAFVPWKGAHQKNLDPADLPPAEQKMALFALARERFLAAGYEPIGMDHFARPDDELGKARREGRLRRNFQGYTVIPASDCVGLGISAIGDLSGAYVQNTKKLSGYERALNDGRLPIERGVLRSPDDELRRAVIHALMCNFVVDIRSIEASFGVTFDKTFAQDLAELRGLEQEGLVTVSTERIEATPVGELFVRNLAMCFDRYYRDKHAGGDQPVFSRTV